MKYAFTKEMSTKDNNTLKYIKDFVNIFIKHFKYNPNLHIQLSNYRLQIFAGKRQLYHQRGKLKMLVFQMKEIYCTSKILKLWLITWGNN